jgi:hypothetical protein
MKSKLLPIIFCLLISIPILCDVFQISFQKSTSENRAFAKKPDFNISNLDPFPNKYDNYFNDNFKLRRILLNSYNYFLYSAFDISPVIKNVCIGKQGWLYYMDKELPTYNGQILFTDLELKTYKELLEYKQKYLKEKNCKYYFVIAPTKYSVYPEFLPNRLFKKNQLSITDQLINYLKKNSSINIIDLRPALVDAKKYGRLYHKNDNHWNELGAFFAYQKIMAFINKDYPELQTMKFSDFKLDSTIGPGGNLANMMAITSLKEWNPKLNPLKKMQSYDGVKKNYTPPKDCPYPDIFEVVKTTENKQLPKLMMVRDSYGEAISKFIGEGFSNSILIFDAWQYKINSNIVETEKPDIYITMVLESHLSQILLFRDN